MLWFHTSDTDTIVGPDPPNPMVNWYSWHKVGAKGGVWVCRTLKRLLFDEIGGTQGYYYPDPPFCANLVPRISVDHWVRGVWAYYYLGFRPRRPLALHWLGVSLSQSWFSDQLVFSLDLQKIILGTHTSFRISCRWKGIHNHSTIVRMWGTLACGVSGTVRHAKNLNLIISQSVAIEKKIFYNWSRLHAACWIEMYM